MTQIKKISTVYNEAGRLVMAYLINEDTAIMDSLLKGRKPVIKHTFRLDNFSEDGTKIFFAGTAAQHIYAKSGWLSEDDDRKEMKVLSYTVDGDTPLQQKVEELKKETKKIISDNWNMVECLAKKLYKQKTLTSKQIVKILNKCSKGKE